MKRCLSLLVIFLVAGRADAQPTIALGTISTVFYCIGDTVAVPYSTTGTFADGNVFSAELSDANGSFAAPTVVGTSSSPLDTIRFALLNAGLRYRVRVTSSSPAIVSNDNGTDLEALYAPLPVAAISAGNDILSPVADSLGGSAILAGQTVLFSATSVPAADSFFWAFPQDASVLNDTGDSVFVSFSSPGLHTGSLTAINRAGCGTEAFPTVRVLSCNATIPLSAADVTDNEGSPDPFVWVKAGGIDTVGAAAYPQTFFVEQGGTIVLQSSSEWNTYYMKSGATFVPSAPTLGTIVSTAGTRYTIATRFNLDTLSCPDLEFQIEDGVAAAPAASEIRIVQSGTSLSVVTGEQNYGLRLYDLLGSEVFGAQGSGTEMFDLASLSRGIYFAIVETHASHAIAKVAIVP